MGVLRRIGPYAAVAALLAVAALGAVLGSLPVHPAALGEPDPPATHAARSAAPAYRPPDTVTSGEGVAVPDWMRTVVTAVCLLVVVAVVALLIVQLVRTGVGRRLGTVGRGPARAPRPLGTAASVVAALDAGLSALDDDDGDPRRAVIACWVRLESAAAAAGTPRRPGDTPTDLVMRLLEAHEVSAGVLTGFADIYRQARYAPHVVDATMRAEARDALGQLRAVLTAEVASA